MKTFEIKYWVLYTTGISGDYIVEFKAQNKVQAEGMLHDYMLESDCYYEIVYIFEKAN